jgi:hypothetical protein
MPKREPGAAMRMSQAAASSVPPPTHTPSMAAMVGMSHEASASSAAEFIAQKSASGTLRSLMSEPAEKWPSVPRRMRTSTSGAASIACRMSGSANHISRERAPSFCGRSIVSVAIAPSVS